MSTWSQAGDNLRGLQRVPAVGPAIKLSVRENPVGPERSQAITLEAAPAQPVSAAGVARARRRRVP